MWGFFLSILLILYINNFNVVIKQMQKTYFYTKKKKIPDVETIMPEPSPKIYMKIGTHFNATTAYKYICTKLCMKRGGWSWLLLDLYSIF